MIALPILLIVRVVGVFVEFKRDQGTGLDRGLAMILAPILEQQARLVSERARIT